MKKLIVLVLIVLIFVSVSFGAVTRKNIDRWTGGWVAFDANTDFLTYDKGIWIFGFNSTTIANAGGVILTGGSLQAKTHGTATIVIAAYNSLDANQADIKCDGVNDSNDINAIAQSLTGGGDIFLLDGKYHAGTTTINLLSNTTLRFSKGAELVLDVQTVAPFYAIASTSTNNVRIDGANIDGNNTSNTTNLAQSGIYFTSVDNFIIENCNIQHFGRAATASCVGIFLNACTNGTIRNNYIYDTVDNINTTGNCYKLLITGNICNGTNKDYSINLPACYDSIISNNICRNSLQDGINLTGNSNDNLISGNLIYDCNKNGILFGTANNTGNTIINNQIYNCGTLTDNTYHGIQLSQVSSGTAARNMIRGNKIRKAATGNTTAYGIYLKSHANILDNKIIGNDVNSSGVSGDIYVGPLAVQTLVKDNITSQGLIPSMPISRTTSFNAFSGVDYDNLGATADINAFLPQATVGKTVTFTAVAAYDINVIPYNGDRIRKVAGGVATVMDVNERYCLGPAYGHLKMTCRDANYWTEDANVGTLVEETP
jgi:hypothetical protein